MDTGHPTWKAWKDWVTNNKRGAESHFDQDPTRSFQQSTQPASVSFLPWEQNEKNNLDSVAFLPTNLLFALEFPNIPPSNSFLKVYILCERISQIDNTKNLLLPLLNYPLENGIVKGIWGEATHNLH